MKKAILIVGLSFISISSFSQFNVSGVTPNDLFWNAGQVGIGLTNPTAKLDIRLTTNFMYEDESGFRLTYPVPAIGQYPGPPTINNNMFEIRQNTLGGSFSTRMVVKVNGRVGIGIADPDATFHVRNGNGTGLDAHIEGFTLLDGNESSLLLGRQTGAPYGEWGIEYNNHSGGLNFWKPSGATTGGGNYHLFIKDNGKVSIGLDPNLATTYNGDYKLYVANGILTERVKVALKTTSDWADYVFAEDYKLKTLSEVEEYIKNHKHLPGVPSAEEVVETGIDMAQMDAKLLEKIEELTLYIIDLEKKLQAQEEKIESIINH